MAYHTLEALHNLTRSGASSSLSRMSPAASPPDSGIPARWLLRAETRQTIWPRWRLSVLLFQLSLL